MGALRGTLILRLLIGLALIAWLAVPALAQRRSLPTPSAYQEEQLRKQKEAEAVDRDYKATMERTNKPAAPVVVDPWQSMRGPNDTKR